MDKKLNKEDIIRGRYIANRNSKNVTDKILLAITTKIIRKKGNPNEWRNISHVSLCCSILGMNLFGCKFCDTLNDDSDVECDRKNFDSLLWATVTVFQVLKG